MQANKFMESKKKQPKFFKESEKNPIKIGFIIKKINLRNDKSHKKSVGIYIKGHLRVLLSVNFYILISFFETTWLVGTNNGINVPRMVLYKVYGFFQAEMHYRNKPMQNLS
jgi:hypothetical protein